MSPTPSATWWKSIHSIRPPRRASALRWADLAHEAAAYGTPVAGQPAGVLHGRRFARRIHLQVRVQRRLVGEPTRNAGIATGDKYLNAGTLYVAKFNADGSGELAAADAGQPGHRGLCRTTPSADLADICVNTRLAADAVGATKMDRPEWTAVNPKNGDVYAP